jgi:ribosomal protein S18 acetylase RimI-like enzyme
MQFYIPHKNNPLLNWRVFSSLKLKKEGVMEKISIIRYSPRGENHPLTAQLVECYRNVFADEPWHEWLKCRQCGEYWGVKDRAMLASMKFRHCGKKLVDFWPKEQVISDLHHEITPSSSCWLAMDKKVVVGFCWGYPIAVGELKAKLNIQFSGQRENELIVYQDEVGVLSAYRGRNIAKAMVLRRLDDFLNQGLKFGIVRTRQNPEPSVTFTWYTQKLGYEILAAYPGNDGRVILGRRLNELRELLI